MTGYGDNSVPNKGWTCIGIEDIRDGGVISVEDAPYETCQMCGREEIRFVHSMEHVDYPDILDVGCICAGNMENHAAAQEREKEARNKAGRKSRWLSRKWKISRRGNHYLRLDGNNVGVYPRRGQWGYFINGHFSSQLHSSRDIAKLALFDEYYR